MHHGALWPSPQCECGLNPISCGDGQSCAIGGAQPGPARRVLLPFARQPGILRPTPVSPLLLATPEVPLRSLEQRSGGPSRPSWSVSWWASDAGLLQELRRAMPELALRGSRRRTEWTPATQMLAHILESLSACVRSAGLAPVL